jgi:hypothetical protein
VLSSRVLVFKSQSGKVLNLLSQNIKRIELKAIKALGINFIEPGKQYALNQDFLESLQNYLDQFGLKPGLNFEADEYQEYTDLLVKLSEYFEHREAVYISWYFKSCDTATKPKGEN